MITLTTDNDKNKKSLQITSMSIFSLIVFVTLIMPCQSHFHDHYDDYDYGQVQSPSFKYSKEANEHFGDKAHDHTHDFHDKQDNQYYHFKKKNKPHWRPLSDYMNHIGDVFVQAMGSTFLISIIPFFILYFVPVDNTKESEHLLRLLLSFASGALLGDAFFHLIPHAILFNISYNVYSDNSKKKGHLHNIFIGSCILAGIVIFLLVEKTVYSIKNSLHNHPENEEKLEISKENNTSDDKEDSDSDSFKSKSSEQKLINSFIVAGYLNLAADFLHNFTDGLAIGASYLAGNTVGYTTSFTILLHKVPHEIGDFALLVQSGTSKPKAILLQLVTAVGALLGTFISLLVEGMDDLATRWILPFTAGGFIYIATVSVIPELLIETNFWQSIKEVIAILAGVYMMILVAQLE